MLTTAGVQSEAHLAFAGLHQMLRPLHLTSHCLLSTQITADIEAVTALVVLLRSGHLLADRTTDSLIRAARDHAGEVRTDVATARRLQATYPISSLVSGSDGVLGADRRRPPASAGISSGSADARRRVSAGDSLGKEASDQPGFDQ